MEKKIVSPRTAFALITPIALSACTITQTVEPASVSSRAVVCIVEDPAVREGFLVELRKILDQKLIAYEIVDKQRSMDCEWSATYTARWSWDLALYMSFAQITVYHNGKLDGEAIYDATKGGGRMDKFIDAETKIRELVDSLIQQTGG